MKQRYLFIVLFAALLHNAFSQPLTPTVVNIPMRDGKTLAADVYLPNGTGKFPVILIQTPYNRVFYRWNLPLGIGINLATSNYAFVIVDWRCFYGSSAACVANPNRGQDGYDVVQWIASQTWSDGKVATWGPSALGGIQYQTAKEKPANLVCCVPQVAGSQFDYLSYFPGGVYRTEYVQQLDALGYGMSTTLLANPVYNFMWQYTENTTMYPEEINVPMFMIGGWYDFNVEEMLTLFDSLKAKSGVTVRNKHKFLMGPWVHGGSGSAYVGSATQGELSYPGAKGWSDSLAMRFFDFYLRGIANNWNNEPVIRYFQMGEDTWNSSVSWPPALLSGVKLFLHANGLLDPALPSTTTDKSTIVYDPRDPSPTYGGPTLKQGLKQGPYNQKDSVESRNDILLFTTPVLSQNVRLRGSSKAYLYVSSDRFDTDVAIRLTDVYPDGRSMMVADGIRRMRFRKGYTAADTSRIVPGQIYAVEVELPNTAITFLAGHRIRVDITSSNYPRFDYNLNNGGKMYAAGDTLIATNTVYHNSTNPSYVSFAFENYPASVSEKILSNPFVSIYPNPVKEKVFLSFDPALTGEEKQIEVYSLAGYRVHTALLNGKNITIDASGWGNGVYFVKVISGNKVNVKKMLKE